ncbi:uncharacterized protein TM35_000222690 [Trypanosoma theileri]|uniref:Uncharacterized protein n=1 Tax=Trypanosoma theileri TaxID=67003 RepID=A0A1X0NTN3_9TRYP|nr:uncharacterized protein TM35_000222690 [Trypanosoma theileri]ORC87470.1 hypothetical protein TM35_000222690 [Trypanosoma theileri]
MGRRRWMLLTGIAVIIPSVLLYTIARRRGRRTSVDVNKKNGTPVEYTEEQRRYHDMLHSLKERANAHFQASRYEEALAAYQECLDVTAALRDVDAESMLVDYTVRANVVMVFLRLQRPEEARIMATLLLQQPDSTASPLPNDLKVKVLYRRGLASRALGDNESALCDFRAAVQLSPGQRNLQAEKEIAALLHS